MVDTLRYKDWIEKAEKVCKTVIEEIMPEECKYE